MTDFSKGDRVQLSAHGLKAYRHTARHKPERVGTVIRCTADATFVVHWDGNKREASPGIHPNFLKQAERSMVDDHQT